MVDDKRPFVQGAKVQTMLRDFDKLRTAIRSHDSFATEAAWEKCERWLGLSLSTGSVGPVTEFEISDSGRLVADRCPQCRIITSSFPEPCPECATWLRNLEKKETD